MRALFLLVILLFTLPATAETPSDRECFNRWGSKQALKALKEAEFKLQQATQKQLMGMRHCLASKDPVIRDDIAYQAFFSWLREDVLPLETKQTLARQLMTDIQQRRSDPQGVYLPFAVLVLSEVIRADRVAPFISADQRRKFIKEFSAYLNSINDYRGYDDKIGWRHQVAHSADVVLQVVVSTNFATSSKLELLNALANQITPEDHFYHFGEPKRIARAVAYAMMTLPDDTVDWKNWLLSVSQPTPFRDWATTYKSEAGLCKRHNTTAFLQSLLTYTHQADALAQYQALIMDRLIAMQ